MKIVAIVQARMASTRLPGKVMKKIQGKTLFEILFFRLSLSKKIDSIVFAIPNNKKDNIMKEAHVSASSDALPTKLNLKNMTTNEKEIDLVRSEDAVNKALKSDRARFDQIRKTGKKYEMNDLADELAKKATPV